MKHFLFEDWDNGEYFLVGADDLGEAYDIAEENFANPYYVCEYTDDEAEMSGLDEY